MSGIYFNGVRFAANGAAGVSFNGVRLEEVLSTGVCLVMTPHHVGRSLNFLTSNPTVWDDIGPLLAAPTIGHYFNMALDKATGEAWILTQKAGAGTDAENGIFYCADTTETIPVWTLVYSQQDYIDEVTALFPTWTPQQLNALGLTDTGTVYAQAIWSNLEAAGYVWGDSVGIQYQRCPVFNQDLYNRGYQFSLWAGPTTARAVLTGGANPAGRIIEMTDAVAVSVWHSFAGANGLMSLHQNHVIQTNLYSFIDGDDGNMTLVYAGAHGDRPIVITDGFIFWTRTADTALMIDAAVQALANTAGGITGVFSAAGAAGGAYCNVLTYDHIIWVASSAHASNSIRDIGYTADGGTSWETKTGNWAMVMGDWEGDAGLVCPMVACTGGGGATGVFFNAVRFANA